MFDSQLLKGKTIIVTGGGTGLGKSMATRFAELGANLVITSRRQNVIDETAKILREHSVKVLAISCDVREPDQVESMVNKTVEEFGGIDILLNNAAGNFFCPTEELSENAWRAVVDIVLDGTFRVSKACLPLMKKNGGSVVNIIANYAWNAAPYVGHSGAAKAGVLNLTRTLALEWSKYKIRVNAMCPGIVLTDSVKQNLLLDKAIVEKMESNIPIGGITEPEKMAQQVLYLCSPAADVITGDMIIADGGQWLVGNAFYAIGKEFLR